MVVPYMPSGSSSSGVRTPIAVPGAALRGRRDADALDIAAARVVAGVGTRPAVAAVEVAALVMPRGAARLHA